MCVWFYTNPKTSAFQTIIHLCPLLSVTNRVAHLDSSWNKIRQLSALCFQYSPNLKTMDLSNNVISHIDKTTFRKLPDLICLNVSSNELSQFAGEYFKYSSRLSALSCIAISSNHEAVPDFKQLSLHVLETDDFRFCCFLPQNTRCTVNKIWYSSCADILPNLGIKVMFYCASCLILAGNLFSLLIQVKATTQKVVQTMAFVVLVCSLNCVNVVSSVPLWTLWIADLLYGSDFVICEHTWRTQLPCHFIFGIFMGMTFIQPGLVLLMALARMMVVLCPIDTKFKNSKYAINCLSGVITTGIVLSLCFTFAVHVETGHEGLPLALCSPLFDPAHKLVTIRVIHWFVLLTQSTAIVLIVSFYAKLIVSLHNSQRGLQDAMLKKRSYKHTAVQVVYVSVYNVLPWVTSNAVHMASMFVSQYPLVMVYWVTVVVIPLSSVLSPAVFITTTTRKLCGAKYT